MSFMKSLREKAKKSGKTIVLPEGTEPRTVKAAAIIAEQEIASVILIGNIEQIQIQAKEQDVSLTNTRIKLIDPVNSEKLNEYAKIFYDLRKHKGITEEKAIEIVKDEVYFGTMMVHVGDADGLVSGAAHSTGDTIRPSLQIIKTKPGISVVSSCFVMIVPNCDLGSEGMFVFGDCAVNPDPNAEQLAEIAISSAETAKVLCDMDPKVAMLSFSSKGSASHEFVDKVQKATEIIKSKSDISVDGELQADAAIIERVAIKKAPDSKIAGKANVLIFPDLQSGNIAYKLVERLAGADAIGPLLQGIKKPINDLSRGCSVEDIVNVTAITSVQANN